MVALTVWKSAETVILFVPSDCAGTVERELRRIPGADSTHPLTIAVSLVLHHLLNILCPPVMKTLFLGAVLTAFEIELFHHDDVSTVVNRQIHDERCRFDGNRIIDAFRLRPKPRHLAIPLLLGVLDTLQCTIQRVFFTVEMQKASREDKCPPKS